MALQRFCDLCDRHIPPGDPTYNAATGITERSTHSDRWTGQDLRLDPTQPNRYTSTDNSLGMIDEKCMIEIIRVIESLRTSSK